MADSITAVFTGRLVGDTEPAMLGTKPAIRYRVAVNVRKKDGDGWKDYAMYVRCTDFRVEGAKFLVKSAQVQVAGRLQWDPRPEDKGGFYSPEVIVYHVDLMSFAHLSPEERQRPHQERKSAEVVPF